MDGESRGERDRTVVRALAALEPLTAATPDERRRMRDRILLALDDEPSRPLADTRRTDAPRPVTPRGRTGPRGGRGVFSGARGRFAVAAIAVLALMGSLAGMSLLLARDALPGDALYGVKRTAEAAELGLTFGDEQKALKHLEFAASRVSEIETLARRYANPDDAPVGGYLTALTDFDNDTTAGSRGLITLATSTDGRLLTSLREWATQQSDRLTAVSARLPAAGLNRVTTSQALLAGITARADALWERMACFEITSGSYDDIGALPASGECTPPAPVTPPVTPPGQPPVTPPAPSGPGVPDGPVPPAVPTPEVPPVPVPGATVSVPAPVPSPTSRPPEPPESSGPPSTSPPLIQLPPLLPGLPGLGIG